MSETRDYMVAYSLIDLIRRMTTGVSAPIAGYEQPAIILLGDAGVGLTPAKVAEVLAACDVLAGALDNAMRARRQEELPL